VVTHGGKTPGREGRQDKPRRHQPTLQSRILAVVEQFERQAGPQQRGQAIKRAVTEHEQTGQRCSTLGRKAECKAQRQPDAHPEIEQQRGRLASEQALGQSCAGLADPPQRNETDGDTHAGQQRG